MYFVPSLKKHILQKLLRTFTSFHMIIKSSSVSVFQCMFFRDINSLWCYYLLRPLLVIKCVWEMFLYIYVTVKKLVSLKWLSVFNIPMCIMNVHKKHIMCDSTQGLGSIFSSWRGNTRDQCSVEIFSKDSFWPETSFKLIEKIIKT